VSNPKSVPFPITAELALAAAFAAALSRDTLAPFSSNATFPREVLAPVGYVKTGEEVTVRIELSGTGAIFV
jgi:hypothetical protein